MFSQFGIFRESHKETQQKGSKMNVSDIVVFSKVPNGSYLRENTEYRVEHVSAREVYFHNVKRGSGTSDTHSMLKTAIYTVTSQPTVVSEDDYKADLLNRELNSDLDSIGE